MANNLLIIPTENRNKYTCCFCGTQKVKYFIRFFDPDTKQETTMQMDRKVACCNRCAALFMGGNS